MQVVLNLGLYLCLGPVPGPGLSSWSGPGLGPFLSPDPGPGQITGLGPKREKSKMKMITKINSWSLFRSLSMSKFRSYS